MRAILISDAHIRAPDDGVQRSLVSFLDQVCADELVLVGDMVDFWWSSQRTVFVDYVPLLAALQRFDGRVTWVMGNHELRCQGALEVLGIRTAPNWMGTTTTGDRVLAVHGDRADNSFGHRLWSRVLRSPRTSKLVGLMGPDRVFRLAGQLSARSRASHTATADLLAAQNELADGVLAGPFSYVCVGHTHAPGVAQREGGTLVNLGDWQRHRTFAVVEESVSLMRYLETGWTTVSGPPAARDAGVSQQK